MCGIYGILQPNASADTLATMANAMGSALAKRGPDHHGHYAGPGTRMGMRRLAVIDLVTGNQPVWNEDESLFILYNGEVYNHAELRTDLEARGHRFRTQSDTEAVLHAYEEYGTDALVKLNGMFAFAIYAPSSKTLFLARDRLGIKPLYVAALSETGFAFASEAKALLPALTNVEPDWTAIARYFAFGYVPSPDAPFRGIRKLPPGHWARFDGDQLSMERYWEPHYGSAEGASFDDACAQTASLLSNAVRKELMADVPLGIFLSGGLDSAAVAHFARQHRNGPLHSFGLRFPEKTHDESDDSRLLANHLGIEHHEVPFDDATRQRMLLRAAEHLDEPFADATVLPLLALSEVARDTLTVVLTGWGGDELFAGYPTYRAHQLAALYRQLPACLAKRAIPWLVNRLPVSDRYMSFEFKARRFVRGVAKTPAIQHLLWMGYFDPEAQESLFTPDVFGRITDDVFQPVRELDTSMDEEELIARIQHLDARTFLEGNGLFQADRMTMAVSLEARVPLLNNDLIDFVSALPTRIKMHGNVPKALLRTILAPHVPPRIRQKPKKGFGPPTAQWMRGDFLETFDRLFTRERINRQGIFRAQTINRLVQEHRARRADHGRNLWALLAFQLWYERFIENNLPGEIAA